MLNKRVDFTKNFSEKYHIKTIDIENKSNQYLVLLILSGIQLANSLTITDSVRNILKEWVELLGLKTSIIDRLLEDKNIDNLLKENFKYFYKNDETPFIPELLFYSNLALMLNSTDLNQNQINSGLTYLKRIEEYLGLESEFTLVIKGWLTDKADSDINQITEEIIKSINNESFNTDPIIDFLFKKIKTAKEVYKINKTIDEKEWTKIKKNLSNKLNNLESELLEFNLDLSMINEFNQVKNFIEESLFRISILGEFKRGKSTIINSLLDVINLVPAATLPCTSGVIEIKYGNDKKFYLKEEGATYKYNEINESDFNNNSGNAHKNIETRRNNSKEEYNPEKVNRWRVEYNSNFLKDYQIELIDTPGLNESPLRDMMSLEEAQYTDAAIFVLDATQQASLTELDFLSKVKPLSKNIIFAINKGDSVDRDSRDEIVAYCYSRIQKVLPDIPISNFVLISAKEIENHINKKSVENHKFWIDQFKIFKKRINTHLLKNSAPKRLEKISNMVNLLDKKLSNKLNELLENKKTSLNQFSQLEQKSIEKKNQKEELINSIKIAASTIETSWENCSKQLTDSVNLEVIPDALKKLEKDKDSWKSEHNPIFNGKKFITEIAKIAEIRIQFFIRESLSQKANPIISKEIDSVLKETSKKIENKLENYLKDYKNTTEEILDDVKNQTFQNFAAIAGMNLDANSSIFLGTSLTTVVSVIVGYIVADIILYYILGVISGFLNPYLIVAAIVLAIGGILFKGTDVVRSFIKTKVYDKFKEKLSEKETQNEIKKGIDRNIKIIFQQISKSFEKSANSVIDEIEYHRDSVKKEIDDLAKKYGTDKKGLEEIISKMESDKDKSLAVLTSIIKDINQIANEEKELLFNGN